MDIFFRPVQQVNVDLLPHPVVVQRGIGIGHDEARRLPLRHGSGHEFVVLRAAQVSAPQLQEHDGEAADGLAPEHHGGVLPVAVFFAAVDVFIRQIHAAVKSGMAVDDEDLSVIPEIVVGGNQGRKGREDLAADAQGFQFPVIAPGQ